MSDTFMLFGEMGGNCPIQGRRGKTVRRITPGCTKLAKKISNQAKKRGL